MFGTRKRRLTAVSRQPEAGSWKLEAGSWKLEAGSWKLEAGSWKPATAALTASTEPPSSTWRNERVERPPLDELHDQRRVASGFSRKIHDAVDVRDPAVIERRDDLRLTLESRESI